MTYNDAYKYLYEHMTTYDQKIINILEGLIRDKGGLDIIINRNWPKGWVTRNGNIANK